MDLQRRAGRSNDVQRVASTAIVKFGMSPWTVHELKQKTGGKLVVKNCTIKFMHGAGLIRKTGMKKTPNNGYSSSWVITMKGKRSVMRWQCG